MEIILLSLLSSLGLVFTLFKLFKWNALRFDWAFDIVLTIGLPICFVGSFSGMTLAMLTGVFVSIELFILKRMIYRMKR